MSEVCITVKLSYRLTKYQYMI